MYAGYWLLYLTFSGIPQEHLDLLQTSHNCLNILGTTESTCMQQCRVSTRHGTQDEQIEGSMAWVMHEGYIPVGPACQPRQIKAAGRLSDSVNSVLHLQAFRAKNDNIAASNMAYQQEMQLTRDT